MLSPSSPQGADPMGEGPRPTNDVRGREPMVSAVGTGDSLLSNATLPRAPRLSTKDLFRSILRDMNDAGISILTIVREAVRGISAEAVRWGGAFTFGVLALQSAVEGSGFTLPYMSVSYGLFLVADQLDGIWRTRVDASDRAYMRRLKERLLDTLGSSSLRDIGDEKRQAALELQYNRTADISNLVEQSAAIPSYMTKVILSGGALLAVDWRVGAMVALAVVPGILIKSRHTREDLDLEERQASNRKVLDKADEEVYRPEGVTKLVLGGLRKRIQSTISQLQFALDHEKDLHERKQNAQLFVANLGYYGSLFGGVTLLHAQLQAGAVAVGTFFFLCHQLQEFGEEIASHGDTFQNFRKLMIESRRFYEFTQHTPEAGSRLFPPEHHISIRGARFEREGFSVTVPQIELPPGSLLLVKGGSGAGKTTLLEHLAFASRPEEGEVLIGGVPVHDLKFSAWRDQIAYCGARPALVEGRTVGDILRGNDVDDEHLAERSSHPFILGIIKKLESDKGLDTRVGVGAAGGRGFSTGEIPRLALIAALLPRRRIVFIDEATAHQSDEFITSFSELLAAQRSLGTTIIFATHSKRFDSMATHILKVVGGVAELQPRPEGRIEESGGDAESRLTA